MTIRIDKGERSRLCARVEIQELIGRSVTLKRSGDEYVSCCPFHNESTPSFTVAPKKAYYHCFGCGAHGDALSWLIEYEGLEFVDACKVLDDQAFGRLAPPRAVPPAALPKRELADGQWVPLLPVPAGVPALIGDDGRTVPVWNPKRQRHVQYRPARADAYRDPAGQLLGYVLRLDFKGESGKQVKITPAVTWCVGQDGTQQWCLCKFPRPRPLCGLEDLAARPDAVVLIVEGEKCREWAKRAFNSYVALCWVGGAKGLDYVDWRPLKGRTVVLWPDADQPGREAMLGWIDRSGLLHRGVAQHAARAGAAAIRYVEVDGQPDGWDIADALSEDGWSPRQLAAWAANRVSEVQVELDPQRHAR